MTSNTTEGKSVEDYQLFIDLDGVLVDFDTGVLKATGRGTGEMPPGTMWAILARTPNFYASLGWMPDGQELWRAVSAYSPAVLTGLPMGQWAEPQKRVWCKRELGMSVPVIAGLSRKKAELARLWLEENDREGKIPVLVDDSIELQERWELNGGIFIHHLSANNSINELAKLGF